MGDSLAGNGTGRRAPQDKEVGVWRGKPRGPLPHEHIGGWQSHLVGRFHNGSTYAFPG